MQAVRAPSAGAVQATGRHRRGHVTQRRASACALVAILPAAAVWLIARWPEAHWLVYGAWLMPLAELGLLVTGHLAYRWRFREVPPGTFLHLIIQVTTAGCEHARVNEIIKQIRGYGLAMPHEIWVVTEPGVRTDYPLADRVLVVPGNFRARSRKKARALEYSRRVRVYLGLDRPDVKIIFNDDDVSLTKGYIERAFAADYDVCQGVIAPRTRYAVRPFGHFLASHADDIRTHACLVYCSVFQGILRRPLHVHGEGLVVTGAAESIVTWDWPVIASEDLVFGQRAVAAHLLWGWFHEYAEVTSPWTLRDYLVQRRRWLWGDIHAMTHPGVMPTSARLLVLAKYLVGVTVLVASAAGLYLRAIERIPASSGALEWAKLSALSWLGLFFTCGWIGAGTARSGDSRLLAGVAAVAMMPATLVLTIAAIVIPLIEGDPRSFSVIAKTKRDL